MIYRCLPTYVFIDDPVPSRPEPQGAERPRIGNGAAAS